MIEIKGCKVSNKIDREKFVDNQGEWAEDLVHKWGCDKYFDSVWCHVEGVQNLLPNAMYIFCQAANYKIAYNKVDYVDVTKLLPLVNTEKDASLDLYEMEFRTHIDIGKNAIQFHMEHEIDGKRILGYYFPDENILWVCDMSHTPQFDRYRPFWNLLVKEYIKPIKTSNKETTVKIMIGADPEFEVINDGCVIMCPTTVVKGNFEDRRLVEKIGTDGARTQIEFRPEPATTPEVLIENIRNLFNEVNHYHLSAKGQGYPVGGHIHFGLVPGEGMPKKLPLSIEFLKLLDHFLGYSFHSLSGIARGGFGQLSGYREQPHGFEYRTLPACIFSNPEICRIILKIAHNLATIHFNNKPVAFETKIPSKEEYMEHCKLTENEYNYMTNYIKNYEPEDYNENIVWNWTERYDNPLNIQFFDLWGEDIKNKFKTELKHIKVPRYLNVILYGISAKKHGLKYAGFPNNKYLGDCGNKMTHPIGCPHPKNGLAFGLPQGERTYADRNGHGPIGLQFCVEAIQNEINLIDWDKFKTIPITSVNLGVL